MNKKFLYSVLYKLNGKVQTERLWADSHPSGLHRKEFEDSLKSSLKRVIDYDNSRDQLDIISIESINQ